MFGVPSSIPSLHSEEYRLSLHYEPQNGYGPGLATPSPEKSAGGAALRSAALGYRAGAWVWRWTERELMPDNQHATPGVSVLRRNGCPPNMNRFYTI